MQIVLSSFWKDLTQLQIKKRANKTSVQSCTVVFTILCYTSIMLISPHRRKENAIWKLQNASDLAKSIALGHEPPSKGREDILHSHTAVRAGQAGALELLWAFAMGVLLSGQEVSL